MAGVRYDKKGRGVVLSGNREPGILHAKTFGLSPEGDATDGVTW